MANKQLSMVRTTLFMNLRLDKVRKIHFSFDNQFIRRLKDIFLSEILIFVKCYFNLLHTI
jgi:hypothetical protein